MNDSKNFAMWLVFMVMIYIGMAILETFFEVPNI